MWPCCEAKKSRNSDVEGLWGLRRQERRDSCVPNLHANTNNSHNHIQPTTAGWAGRVNSLLSTQRRGTKKAIVSLCCGSPASLLSLWFRLLSQLKLLLCLWLACYLRHLHMGTFQGNYTKRATLPVCLIANNPPSWAGRSDVWCLEMKKWWKSTRSVVETVIQDHSEGTQWKQAARPVQWFPLNTAICSKCGK